MAAEATSEIKQQQDGESLEARCAAYYADYARDMVKKKEWQLGVGEDHVLEGEVGNIHFKTLDGGNTIKTKFEDMKRKILRDILPTYKNLLDYDEETGKARRQVQR